MNTHYVTFAIAFRCWSHEIDILRFSAHYYIHTTRMSWNITWATSYFQKASLLIPLLFHYCCLLSYYIFNIFSWEKYACCCYYFFFSHFIGYFATYYFQYAAILQKAILHISFSSLQIAQLHILFHWLQLRRRRRNIILHTIITFRNFRHVQLLAASFHKYYLLQDSQLLLLPYFQAFMKPWRILFITLKYSEDSHQEGHYSQLTVSLHAMKPYFHY